MSDNIEKKAIALCECCVDTKALFERAGAVVTGVGTEMVVADVVAELLEKLATQAEDPKVRARAVAEIRRRKVQ